MKRGVLRSPLWLLATAALSCSNDVQEAEAWVAESTCPSAETLAQATQFGPGGGDLPAPALATGCPAEYSDGSSDPPDIDISACHSAPHECATASDPTECGKRALTAGDYESALRSFERAPDSCDAYFGRYLARLLRLYANWNHQFFGDDLADKFSQTHMTRDTSSPTKEHSKTFRGHYACLAADTYAEVASVESLIDRDLDLIWEHQCTMAGAADAPGGALPIRIVQGRCEAPLSDMVFVGRWDAVDATLLYQHFMGSPGITKRLGDVFGLSNTEPCEDKLCEPLAIDGLEYPRLPIDSEWFLSHVWRAWRDVHKADRDPMSVFVASGSVGGADERMLVRACNTETSEPAYDLEDISVAAQWAYTKSPPVTAGERLVRIYCEDTDTCPLLPGETAVAEPLPAWLRARGQREIWAPSPDGKKVAFGRKTSPTRWDLFVMDIPAPGDDPICADGVVDDDCCVTCDLLKSGVLSSGNELFSNNSVLPEWIPNPNDPKGAALGLLFLHNEHPSSWGWQGQNQGAQLIAMKPDGSAPSQLLIDAPLRSMNYMFHISPDGSRIMWTSSWNPDKGTVGANDMLIATIATDEVTGEFRLDNIHSLLGATDHGWYEAHGFAEDFPEDRRVFFTSSSHSMQSPREFAARLDESDQAVEFFKISRPDDESPGPFITDRHPGWNEHAWSLDQGRQIVFASTDESGSAAERYDWMLAYPPYLEGAMFGLTVFIERFAGLGKLGYSTTRGPAFEQWISNIDGTNRELLLKASVDAGWETESMLGGAHLILDGRFYFTQRHSTQGVRHGFMEFGPR